VHYPGVYSLHSKDDRLADVITRAGGLTSQAYPDGVRFIRTAGLVGRVDVDLPKALKDPKSGANLILQSGDSIVIPEFQPSVRVAGAVNTPGSVLWKQGADLDYYISAAGGATDKAEANKTSVRYANGEVKTRRKSFLHTSSPEPGPGSEVFVPTRLTSPGPSTAPAVWAAIAQMVTSVVAIVALVKK
jgi:protein involved in polysaccharide export with SLBB domain